MTWTAFTQQAKVAVGTHLFVGYTMAQAGDKPPYPYKVGETMTIQPPMLAHVKGTITDVQPDSLDLTLENDVVHVLHRDPKAGPDFGWRFPLEHWVIVK